MNITTRSTAVLALSVLAACDPYPWVGQAEQQRDQGCPDTEWHADRDGDGFGSDDEVKSGCRAPAGPWVESGGDCDDQRATVYPDAEERCDGLDSDCDGTVPRKEQDEDSDGYLACSADGTASWADRVLGGDDCDDDKEGGKTVHPGATERCDGLDNDCDGVLSAGELDQDQDGYVACVLDAGGWLGDPVSGWDDCSDDDANRYPGAPEVCDGRPNDCDLLGQRNIEETDEDGDGYIVCDPTGFTWHGLAISGSGDCNDADAAIHPNAPEGCDGLDTDCDGSVGPDEEDSDGDLYIACDDCDDADPTAFPGNPEVCDGVDNDCVGGVDNGLEFLVYFPDADGDQYGDPASAGQSLCADPQDGRVANFGDCDDTDPLRHPGADEYCDDVDTDCDLDPRDAHALDAHVYYRDADGDLYGDQYNTTTDCSDVPPPGYVRMRPDGLFDCNDSDQDADGDGVVDGTLQHEGGVEVCNGVDSDCNGLVDDNPTLPFDGDQLYYRDSDMDGYGDPGVRSCTWDAGFEDNDGDCNDTDGSIHPMATELPYDGVDGDCDGDADGSPLANSPVVIPGDDTQAGRFGWTMAHGAGDQVLVGARYENSTEGAVYLLEPPFTSDPVPDQAVARFAGLPNAYLTVVGRSDQDLTGDTIADYVLFDDAGYGTVLIVPGQAGGLSGDIDPYATAIRISGTADNPILRAEPVPSVTQDGDADLLITTQWDYYDFTSQIGCTWHGRTWRGGLSVMRGPFTQDITIDDRYAWFQHAGFGDMAVLGGAGDLNGDGYLDIAVGSPKYHHDRSGGSDFKCNKGGDVTVFLGPIVLGEMTPEFHLQSGHYSTWSSWEGYNRWLGLDLDIRHDLDGDGKNELVVGVHHDPNQPPNACCETGGGVLVVRGERLFPSGGPALTGLNHITSVGQTIYRAPSGFGFGERFDVGDLNGDGDVDLIVERPTHRETYVFLGPLVEEGTTHYLTDAVRMWTHTSAITRALLVEQSGDRGEVLQAVASEGGNVGAVYVFPGEDIFGPVLP